VVELLLKKRKKCLKTLKNCLKGIDQMEKHLFLVTIARDLLITSVPLQLHVAGILVVLFS
jgi:hypothetical protein